MSIRSLKYSIYSMIAAIVLQSCGTSYPGIEYSTGEGGSDGNTETIIKTPINVSLNYISLFYANDRPADENPNPTPDDSQQTPGNEQEEVSPAKTRGTGAFDIVKYPETFRDLYMASHFYVLGMRRTIPSAGEMAYDPSYATRFTDGSNSGGRDCMVGSEWAAGRHPGKLSRPKGLDGSLAFIDDEKEMMLSPMYWNGAYEALGYNFFGYYIDDAKINAINPTADRIDYDITIDGSQDIMTGYAPALTYNYLQAKYPQVEEQYYDELLFNGSGGYSLFGAKYGVNPVIDLNHALTRIKLNIIQMDNTKDENGMEPDITLISVKVKSKSRLNLCVASKDWREVGIREASEEVWFELRDIPTIENGEKTPGAVPPAQKLEYLKSVQIGESFMLVPENRYELEVTYKQKLMTNYNWADPAHPIYEDIEHKAIVPLRLDDYSDFLPGHSYYGTLRMWGAQRIDAVVGTTPWGVGGNSDIDLIQ